ncbi:hypothetical protein C1H46_028876 [Malus baccata]|uniref:Uncharacterized protein n=1 Tax=Malus baccata TaxID=106549 RepID=A0A540LGH0_MALBA|nr:hypothetical protein C1H46_028876 [Malus baccata]
MVMEEDAQDSESPLKEAHDIQSQIKSAMRSCFPYFKELSELILVGMRFTSIWSVNDLAFCNPVMQLCAITCGDDKAIKLYTFEGHDTPVHSVCPHNKQNVHFFFSTSVNGKIKAWLYNNMGYQVDYDASDHSITMMAYGADGKSLIQARISIYPLAMTMQSKFGNILTADDDEGGLPLPATVALRLVSNGFSSTHLPNPQNRVQLH